MGAVSRPGSNHRFRAGWSPVCQLSLAECATYLASGGPTVRIIRYIVPWRATPRAGIKRLNHLGQSSSSQRSRCSKG